MSHFVLIHGAWHGAWCWYRLIPALQRRGHQVTAPDLPGHGRDRSDLSSVSLQAYADRVCEVLDGSAEPVVLVGHSMGGIAITQAAEQRPERIRRLVYLASFAPVDGQAMSALRARDTGSLLAQNLVASPDRRTLHVREETLREVFYADCTEEDVTLARCLLAPQAIAPILTPLRLSPERHGRVPRSYIECRQDRAHSLVEQRRLCAEVGFDPVLSLDSSHSPFLSAPEALAGMLHALAQHG